MHSIKTKVKAKWRQTADDFEKNAEINEKESGRNQRVSCVLDNLGIIEMKSFRN